MTPTTVRKRLAEAGVGRERFLEAVEDARDDGRSETRKPG
jgi:hypothetical protein